MLPLAMVSCNDKNNTQDTPAETIEKADKPEVQASGDEYIFPALDCGEDDFTFLNVIAWIFYTTIVHEEMTGEVLDDAIYTRNRLIEEKFNVNIKEEKIDNGTVANTFKKTVLAGDELYDAAYLPANFSGSNIGVMITEGMFQNLTAIPELNLSEPWWNQNINKDARIGSSDALYFAGCDINIYNLQGAWCVYFNEDMFQNLGLDFPYAKVKNGKWTFDEFYSYAKAGAQLNGAENYKWNLESPAIYGHTSYEFASNALIASAGEKYITKDDNGMPRLAIESERYYNVCEKIAAMNKNEGEYLNANSYSIKGFHFMAIFNAGRAAMMIGELGAADDFKAMENVYGIVPLPKYDENQKEYYTLVHNSSPLLVVPVTNSNLPRTGTIIDALAYVSHRDTTPVFYNITLSVKRLQNEESIDMLKIIRDSVFIDFGIVFDWSMDLIGAVSSALDSGKSEIASVIEKNRDQVKANMEKTMQYFGQ